MGKTGNTPHLNNWMRTFKNIAGGTGRIAVETLKSVTPNITDTATSATDVIRESRDFINKTRTQLAQQTTMLDRTKLGSSAKDIISNAYNDIRSGSFTLDKLNDQSFDSLGDFDIDTADVDLNDPDSVALYESKKNTAIIGKAVTEGSIATIEGMKHMTSTLASVNVKASNAAVAKITNVALLGINQTNSQLIGINNKLDNINANLTAMVTFQNQTTLAANQAAMEYYSQSSQLLYEMGKTLAEIKDFNDNQKKLQNDKPKSSDNEFDTSYGFSLRDYGKFIKNNIKHSPLGMIGSMGGMLKSMGGMGKSMGMNPMEMILPMFTSSLIPKDIKKSLERLDRAYLNSIDEILYRIGDLRNSNGLITPMIGEFFGKRRNSSKSSVNMGNFKKDAMSWNGVAQKTLVEVIPSYLAKIESALTHKDARYYNMGTGKFMTESEITNDLSKQLTSTFEFGMRDFTTSVMKNIDAQRLDQRQLREVQNQLNQMAHNQINGTDTRNRVEQNQQLFDLLKSLNMDNNSIRDAMMEWAGNIRETQKRQQELLNAIGNDTVDKSVYRNLYNTHGRNNDRLLQSGSLFSSNRYTDSGRLMDDLTEDELFREQQSREMNERFKNARNRAGDWTRQRFGRGGQSSSRPRISTRIDNASNAMYDAAAGIQTRINDTSQQNQSRATSRATYNAQQPSLQRNTQFNAEMRRLSSNTLTNVLNSSPTDVERESKRINNLIETSLTDDPRQTKTADLGLDVANENTNSLKTLILDLHTNFLKPMIGGIFGKGGFLSSIWENEKIQKGVNFLKEKLFNEKDGLFAPVVRSFYDQLDHFKYVITGKGYTNRKGETFKDNDNSVLSHLKNGYDFVFKNTMKYMFGDDYESNDTFNKYFKWMDIKGKKKDKDKKTANIEAVDGKKTGVNLTKESKGGVSLKKESKTGVNLVKDTPAKINDNLVTASEQVAEKLIESGDAMSDALLGDFSDKEKTDKFYKKSSESFSSKFKKNLPKVLAGGAVGAAVGTSIGIHGAGLLGSLFLASGPIGGALLGIGTTLLSQSEGFKKFLFGEKDEDGKRLGGIISNKTQQFFKKNLPLIVGGATLGAVKSVFKGALGFGNGGFLFGSLLPGGPIGGALMATGIGLLKSNEKFNKILFGEKDEDGKRTGGIFSKSMGNFGKIMEKSGHFIKGGLKGLGTGAFAGLALSKAGILGAAITGGGPIGMGIAGLGIGIASQTKRFQDLLFGTEEFDEDGNPKGRMKNGLFHKVRNMLVLNVFEPIKDKIQEKAIDFAYWAKDKITYPFRLAFGPILDSLKGIKKNISDAVHDAFNNVAKTVGNAMKAGVKKIFSPFTKLLGGVGKILLSTVSAGAKLALSPLTGTLKVMQLATMGKRLPEYMKQNKMLFQNFGDITQGVRETWANENAEEKYGTGILGKVRKHIGHYRDMKDGIETARIAYDDAMGEQGFNSLNWRNVRREKRGDKYGKRREKRERVKWGKINDLRHELAQEYDNSELRLSDEKFQDVQKKFMKLGISKDKISTQQDLNMLLYNRDDWKDKFESKDKATMEGIAKHGIKMQETREQELARQGTASFQKELLEKFAPISKVFTKLATQEALKKRNRLTLKDIGSINKQLEKTGLTWDELGVNPGDLVDINEISDKDWDAFLADHDVADKSRRKFSGFNDMFMKTFIEGWTKPDESEETQKEPEKMQRYKGRYMKQSDISEFMRNQMMNISESLDEFLKRKGYDEKRQEAQLEVLEDIKASTAATEHYEAVQVGDDTGASRSTVQEISGRKYKSKVFNFISGLNRKRKRSTTEDAESAKARGLHGIADSEAKKDEAKINEEDEKKSSVGEKVKSTLGSMFGTLGSFFSNSGLFAKLGLGLLAAGLFGDKIEKVGSAVVDVTREYVIPFFRDTALPFLSKTLKSGWQWFSEKLPSILTTVTDTIVNNMDSIVDNTLAITGSLFTVVGSALVNIGKRAVNWIADKAIPGGWVPFPEVQDKKNFETAEAAKAYAETTGDLVHENADGTATIMTENDYIDSDGNVATVNHSGLSNALVRSSADYAMHSGTRKVVNKSAKLGLQAAGMVTGITPAGKIVTGTTKLGLKAGKGVVNTTKKIGSTISKKASKQASEETAEALIEKGAKEAAEKVGKEAVAEGLEQTAEKGLKKFITETFEKVCKYADDFAEFISSKSFKAVINNVKTSVLEAMAKSNSKTIQKLYAYITKKTAKQATKDGATAATGGLLQIGFSIYDGISGAFEAAYLFEVDESYVTALMRTVSSIMKVLLGLPVITWLDLIAELYCAFTGNDLKKKMATSFYKILAGNDGDIHIDKAQLAMELEVDNYNAKHGTKLSVDAYNEKKNAKWYTKAWNSITGKGNEDYSSYAPSQAQINAAYNARNSSSSKSTASYSQSSSVGNGTGTSSTAIGYGLTQSDSRWGNYVLGKFPDGSTSTMATGGCGPTALAMAANSLGKMSSPLSVAQMATNNGYISDGGANADLFTSGASALGMNSSQVTKSSLRNSLGNGNPIVLAGKSSSSQSPYTKAGHVIMASGIDPTTGKAIVSDPMYNGQRQVDVNELTNGMTHGWSYSNAAGYGPAMGSAPANPNAETTKTTKASANLDPNQLAMNMAASAGKSSSTTDSTSSMTKSVSRFALLPQNVSVDQALAIAASPRWMDKQITTTKDLSKILPTSTFNQKYAYARTLTTEALIKQKISYGCTPNSEGILNFQTAEFYNGLCVGDIRVMAEYDSTLKSDPEISLFGVAYDHFVASKKYKMEKRITTSMMEPLMEAAEFQEALGGYGTNGSYQFKNGIPFYPINDERWSDIVWRGKTVGTRGSDLASFAAVASLYGNNMIPPDYIYNHWLQKYPNWFNTKGLNEPAIFANGGYNALKSTQVDGKRVNIKKISSFSSILSALKQKKPVYMTGYRYDGSIFGGSGEADNIDTDNLDSIGSIVALYANDSSMAINDSSKDISDTSVFNTELLKDTFGKNKTSVIKSAYVVTDPDGKGVESPIDISSKNNPTSKYTSIKDAQGLTGKLAAIISNFAAIGANLLNSLVTGQYTSIKDDTLSDDVEDDNGVITGIDYTPTEVSEDELSNTSSSEAIINDTSSTSTVSTSKAKSLYSQAVDSLKKTHKATSTTNINQELLKLGSKASGVKLTSKEIRLYSKLGVNSGLIPVKTKLKNGVSIFNLPKPKSATTTSRLTSNLPKAVTTTPTPTPALMPTKSSIGNGIGYGTGSTDVTLNDVTGSNGMDTMFNKLSAVMSASMGAQMGGDYKSELSSYIASNYAKQTTSSETPDGTTTTSSASGSGYTNLTGGSTEEIIWNFFRNLGYSAAATAGIMGNLYQESKLNPAIIQGGGKGPAAGIAQWENYNTKSGRWLNLSNYAASKGKDWTDLQSQLEFIDQELNGLNYYFSHDIKYGGNIAGSTLSNAGAVPTTFEQWKNSNDVNMATRQFEGAFERAGKPMMDVRLAKANEYFTNFGSVGNGIGSLMGLSRQRSKNPATIIGYGLETTNPSAVSASTIINRAAMEVGTVETGNNNVKYNTEYYGRVVDGSAYPWCCAFVWWVFKECGASNLFCGGQKVARCATVMSYYQNQGQFFTDNGQPGDLVLFNYGGRISHIGIVVSNNGNGTYTTIEGNTSGTGSQTNGGCVMQKTRSTTNIAGFARPAYGNTDVAFNTANSTATASSSSATGETQQQTYQSPLERVFTKLSNTMSTSISKSLGNGPGSWFTKTLNGKITSGYGNRKTSLGNEYHRGLDIGASKGQPILSPIDGQVVASGNDLMGYGNYAVIKDTTGNNHLFAHMNKPTGYGIGSTVSRNSVIGEVGSTGKATGDHLHYEIRKSGNKYSSIDPTTFRYDDIGKDLNINAINSYENTNSSVGTGNTDISTDTVQQKLDIALNTTGVEEKLDTLIDVVKTWVTQDAQRTNAMHTISNTTNNTSIAYGDKGKAKKTTSTKSSSGSAKYSNMSLASIHQAIAAR